LGRTCELKFSGRGCGAEWARRLREDDAQPEWVTRGETELTGFTNARRKSKVDRGEEGKLRSRERKGWARDKNSLLGMKPGKKADTSKGRDDKRKGGAPPEQ